MKIQTIELICQFFFTYNLYKCQYENGETLYIWTKKEIRNKNILKDFND